VKVFSQYKPDLNFLAKHLAIRDSFTKAGSHRPMRSQ